MRGSSRAVRLAALVIVGTFGFHSTAPAQERPASERPLAVLEAEAAYRRAQLDRVDAEIRVARYHEETFPIQQKEAQDRIAAAAEDFRRAGAQVRTRGEAASPSERYELQRAEFALQEARTRLKILEEFTRDKELKPLEAAVARARSAERDAREAFERAGAGHRD